MNSLLLALLAFQSPTIYVSGPTVTFSADIVDPAAPDGTPGSGVDRAEFFLNGSLVGTVDAADASGDTYTLSWDSTANPDGEYTLRVDGYDNAGNLGSDSVTFSNDNRNPGVTTILINCNGQPCPQVLVIP